MLKDCLKKISIQIPNLGPLLFAIYINDLPDKIENVTKLFADDSKIVSVINGKLEVEK